LHERANIQTVNAGLPGTAGVVRLRQVDSLRAFAVLAVLVHHFLPVGKLIPDDFLTLGLLGVRFFFTLSGFLITGILLRGQSIRTFYLRRALRIFPAYYLCLLVIIVIGVADVRQYSLWHVSYLSNVLFTFKQGIAPATGHFWSLAVEEQFYLVWPWLVLKTPAKHSWKLPVAAILFTLVYKTVIAFTLGGHLAGGLLPFACLDSLGLGGLLACFGYDPRLKTYRSRFLRAALALGSLIVACQTILYFWGRGTRVFYATSYLGVSLIFTWLVGKAADGKLWRLIEARPLVYTGKISYGLYLWHNFMPALAVWLLGYNPGAWTVAAFATLLTFAVAATSWKLVESPLNSLKDKIAAGRRITTGEEALESSAGGI
jgi:peptidoglycan/LPS O-acetylase OafA/YrhL